MLFKNLHSSRSSFSAVHSKILTCRKESFGIYKILGVEWVEGSFLDLSLLNSYQGLNGVIALAVEGCLFINYNEFRKEGSTLYASAS